MILFFREQSFSFFFAHDGRKFSASSTVFIKCVCVCHLGVGLTHTHTPALPHILWSPLAPLIPGDLKRQLADIYHPTTFSPLTRGGKINLKCVREVRFKTLCSGLVRVSSAHGFSVFFTHCVLSYASGKYMIYINSQSIVWLPWECFMIFLSKTCNHHITC